MAPRADTEFEDVSYDGDLGRSLMTGGLGMLTDSLYGADDFLQFDLQFHKPLSEYFNGLAVKRSVAYWDAVHGRAMVTTYKYAVPRCPVTGRV